MRDVEKYGRMCIENLNAIGIYPNHIESFTVNTRAKSRWGQARKSNGKYSINICVDLLNEKCPELSLLDTLYHEILHCVDGCMNHGKEWQDLADLVSDCYNVEITRCSSAEKKLGKEYAIQVANEMRKNRKTYEARCEKCGRIHQQLGYRAPSWYAHPNRYKCRCGGALEIL